MLSSPLPPAQALLVIVGFVALFGLLFLMVKVISLKLSGWREIAERFPMRVIHPIGIRYRNQNGIVGSIQSGGTGGRGFFDIQLAREGIAVYPRFAKRNPCLVPSTAIRRVSLSGAKILVVVDYERPFEFFVPPQAFTAAVASSRHTFEAAKAACKNSTQSRFGMLEDSGAPSHRIQF